MKKTVDLTYANAVALLKKLDAESAKEAIVGETRSGILKEANKIIEANTGTSPAETPEETEVDETPIPQAKEPAKVVTSIQEDDVIIPAIKTKRKATTPWKFSGKLKPTEAMERWAKKNGYRFRFVDSSRPGRIAQKTSEGYELFDKMMLPKADREGAFTEVAELRLMITTEDLAQDREAYFRNKTEISLKGEESQIKNQIGKEGVKVTGGISEVG